MTEHRFKKPYKLASIQIEPTREISPYLSVEVSAESLSTGLKLKSLYNCFMPAYSDFRYRSSEEIRFQAVVINIDALRSSDLLLTVFEFRPGDIFTYQPNENHVFINVLHPNCKITWIPSKFGAKPNPNDIFYSDRCTTYRIIPRGYRYLFEFMTDGEYTEQVYYVDQNGLFIPKGAPTEADLNKVAASEDAY